MINPYDIESDPSFQKFFGKILTKYEIMNDIPCDNAHLEKNENAKRDCQGDIGLIIEAISQQIDEDDIAALFINPTEFGEVMQAKVLDYIESAIEGE